METLTLVAVVAVALFFDFTNGFHDTANAIATSVSTRALSPRTAVLVASVLNFAGAFVSLKVAATVATGIVDASSVTLSVILAGLVGAITWNLVTWLLGLPSSSSHALIGGIAGAAIAADGWSSIQWSGVWEKVVKPGVLSPILGFAIALGLMLLIIWVIRRRSPSRVNRVFRRAQIVSGSFVAFTHGTNDAQKTMGVITLALVANGNVDPNDFQVPNWVVISAATAIALGTYIGGWRIIKTMATRIIKMDAAQGFAAQGAGATVILASSHFGYPLSTTHVINGGIMGAGAAKRLSAVRWGIAGNIAIAWVLTLPASAAIGALVYGITSIFGSGALGPVLVSVALLGVVLAIFARRFQQGSPITATGAQG